MAQQKAKDQIEKALDKVDTSKPTEFGGMSYEQGVEEALMWALGEIPDEEFTYGDSR